MTVFTASKYGAEYAGCTRYCDSCILDIGPGVEEYTLVTLTGTKQVAGNRMCFHLLHSTRYTQCTSRHGNGGIAGYIGMLVTAIYAGKDVTASNCYRGITAYRTGSTMPFTRSIRNKSATAAKYVTVVGMTI